MKKQRHMISRRMFNLMLFASTALNGTMAGLPTHLKAIDTILAGKTP